MVTATNSSHREWGFTVTVTLRESEYVVALAGHALPLLPPETASLSLGFLILINSILIDLLALTSTWPISIPTLTLVSTKRCSRFNSSFFFLSPHLSSFRSLVASQFTVSLALICLTLIVTVHPIQLSTYCHFSLEGALHFFYLFRSFFFLSLLK